MLFRSVSIYNESYTLKSNGNDERILEVVAHVDKMMHSIGDKQSNLSTKDLAILASMNITEEFFKLKNEYQQLIELINEEV